MNIPHVVLALLSLVLILTGVAGMIEGNRIVAIIELALGGCLMYIVMSSHANHPRF
ncbi:MAG: hypothetical protein ABR543_04840 [Gemmatimonadaceae bacterium]